MATAARTPRQSALGPRETNDVNPPPLRAVSARDLPRHPSLEQLLERVAVHFELSVEERATVTQLAQIDRLWASLSFRILLGDL